MVKKKNNPLRFEESNMLFCLLEDALKNNSSAKELLVYYYLSMLIGLLKNESNIYINLAELSRRIRQILQSPYYNKIVHTSSIDIHTLKIKYRIFYYLVKKEKVIILSLIFRTYKIKSGEML